VIALRKSSQFKFCSIHKIL